jgi:signal transduction histidine kinase
MAGLAEELERGAGAIVLTEEALDDPSSPVFRRARTAAGVVRVPILLFAGGDRSQALLRTLAALDDLRNVTLLDRPVRVAAVVSTVRAALRARERQYELRDVLVALHAARDEAERANRLKDEFLATLSHELRTPLNAVLGWVSMLRQAPVSEERLAHILEIIERNAQAQARLIGDVLDVSASLPAASVSTASPCCRRISSRVRSRMSGRPRKRRTSRSACTWTTCGRFTPIASACSRCSGTSFPTP